MHLNADISTALQQMETIKKIIEDSDDAKLQVNTGDHLKLILDILQDPVFRSIAHMQDSLDELNTQITQHPSMLPRDFDISPSGDLILKVPPSIDIYDNEYSDEQRIPSAQLSPRSPPPANSPPPIPNLSSQESSPQQPQQPQQHQQQQQQQHQLMAKMMNYNQTDNDNMLNALDENHQMNMLKKSSSNRTYSNDSVINNNNNNNTNNNMINSASIVPIPINRNTDDDRPHSTVSDSSTTKHTILPDIFASEWTQIQALELVNDGTGLGFGIIGARTSGVIVKTILAGGVADRDGRLMSGDHILQIGDVNLHDMLSEQVASVLRQSGTHVRLVVARPIDPINTAQDMEGTAIVPARLLTDPNELERYLIAAGYPEIFSISSASSTPTPTTANEQHLYYRDNNNNHNNNDDEDDIDDRNDDDDDDDDDDDEHAHNKNINISQRPQLSPPSDLDLPETERFTVELTKDANGLGITIAGYVCEKEELSGIFVKSVSAGSAADLSGRIQVNDRIVEVDRQSLHGFSNHQAVEVLKRSGTVVNLCIERYLRGPKYDQLQQAIAANELKPSTPSHLLPGRPHSIIQSSSGGGSINNQASVVIDQQPGVVVSSVKRSSVPLPDEFATDELQTVIEHTQSTMNIQSKTSSNAAITNVTTTLSNVVPTPTATSSQPSPSPSSTTTTTTTTNNSTRKLIHARDSIENKLTKDEIQYRKTSNPIIIGHQQDIVIGGGNMKMENDDPIQQIDDAADDDKYNKKKQRNSGGGIVITAANSKTSIVQATNLPTITKHKYWIEPELTDEIGNAIKKRWHSILGPSANIIVAQTRKYSEHSGLGISLEGTVDVEGGREVRPHHYIRSILEDGPVGRCGQLRSGDELLEVNGQRLLGMNHIEVVAILKELPVDIRLVCSRSDVEMIAFTEENVRKNLGIGFGGSQNLENILPSSSDRLVKAKSDGSLATSGVNGNSNDDGFIKLKSRSLEPLTGLAMWSSEPQIIELTKGERGLGFSILDYQDPLDANDTLIVIRSLVPGGVAQIDGRLIPGDRLLFVNDINLENSSLDQAVQALKGAAKGTVRIGVAKPLPMAEHTSFNAAASSSQQQQQQGHHSDHNVMQIHNNLHQQSSLSFGNANEPDVIPEWINK